MHATLVALTLFSSSLAIVAADVITSTNAASPTSVKRVVVWDGEEANKGTGWVNAQSGYIKSQTIEAHSGKTALEFKFKGDGSEWPGAGWDWVNFETGAHGTDITGLKTLTFWMKIKGDVADVQLNLLCNGEKLDMPEHHTGKVSAFAYCPHLHDDGWHKVSIPLVDFKTPVGFDPLHVAELHIFNAGAGDGSLFIDDISFDDVAVDKSQTAVAPPR
jgi:Carbohydrate binding domain (family 11)